jgi:hypothetical protein
MGKWLPTPENINALPDGIRDYVYSLETNCDPAGIIAENTLLRDELMMILTNGRKKCQKDLDSA